MYDLRMGRIGAFFIRVSILGVLVSASLGTSVHAQTPALPPQVNPGALNNENQRQQQQLQQQQPIPTIEGPLITGPQRPPAQGPSGASPTFVLKEVHFDKSQFLSDSDLAAIAQAYIGKEVSFADLQHITEAVDALYDKAGIVTASAVLPPQRIADGIVHIALIEGRLGKVDVKDSSYTNNNYILSRVPLQSGEVINVPSLQNELIYFNKTNDIQLNAAVQPGSAFGLTDVQLSVHEPPKNTLELIIDNEGNESTDRNEGGLYFQRVGTLGIDDRFTLYATGSPGGINANASYTVPFDVYGGRVGGSYSQNHIEIVQGALSGKDVTGAFQTTALNLSHPLWVNEQWLLTADGSLSDTQSDNLVSNTITSSDAVDKATTGLTLTALGSDYSLSLGQHIALARVSDEVADSRHWFSVYNGTLLGTKTLWLGITGEVNAAWQYTSAHNLPGDQLFLAGGPTSVRGYEPGAIAGDGGYYFGAELHHDVPFFFPKLDGFMFFDKGAVHSLSTPHLDVAATGVGFNWNVQAITINLIAGVPLERPSPGLDDYRLYARLIWHAF